MNPTAARISLRFAIVPLLLVSLVTTWVLAGPPAERKPVVVTGKVVASYQIKVEDVALVFPDGEVTPEPDPKRLPTLRCEVLVARGAGLTQSLIFDTIITKLEDDAGDDLLEEHRQRTGDPGYHPCSGAVPMRDGKAAIELAIFRTPTAIPRKYSRAAGTVTVSIPTEMTEFEFDPALPAVATINDTVKATFTPMHEKDGKDEMNVMLITTAPEKFPLWDGLGNQFRNYQSFDEAGKFVRPDLISFKDLGLTMRYLGGVGAQVKKFKLLVVSKRLRVRLPFDLRWDLQT